MSTITKLSHDVTILHEFYITKKHEIWNTQGWEV